jgi:hypothetical protein
MVTSNIHDFAQVPNLTIVDWTATSWSERGPGTSSASFCDLALLCCLNGRTLPNVPTLLPLAHCM